MPDKPTITPQLLAELTEQAPNRLRKKLEKKPELANDYTWSQDGDTWTVDTGGETVTLSPSDMVLSSMDQVACTCLLAPKCLHILASANSLSLGEIGVSTDAGEEPQAEVEPVEEADTLEITEAQLAAAEQLFRAATSVLDHGAAHARMTVVAELLRAVHQCRVEGLHRAAAAGLRAAESIRALRENSKGFELESLCRELIDIFETCHIVTHSEQLKVDKLENWVGTARRKYRDIGGMRIFGLFCEPISAKTGYAGVVAYFMNRDGEVWTLSDVVPGESSRIPGAYKGGVRIGDVSASPKELTRTGLFLQSATGSGDGRLGAGKQVKAVTAGGATWEDGIGAAFWDESLSAQLDRCWQSLSTPPLERSPGADLLFFNARVVGAHEDALVVAVDVDGEPRLIRCLAQYNNDNVRYQANMKLLARAPGLGLRIVGRVRFDKPSTVTLMAFGPWNGHEDDEAPTLTLPEDWNGRCNAGLDTLKREFFSHAETSTVAIPWAEPAVPDPLLRMRQRIQRVAYGGRMSLRSSVIDDVTREASQLSARMLPNGAQLLLALGTAAQPKGRSITGELRIEDVGALARAWHTAAVYERGARRSIQRQLFL